MGERPSRSAFDSQVAMEIVPGATLNLYKKTREESVALWVRDPTLVPEGSYDGRSRATQTCPYSRRMYINVVHGKAPPEKGGEQTAMLTEKGARRPKWPRGTKRIISSRNFFLRGCDIAGASYLRVAQTPITGPQREGKITIRSVSCAGRAPLQEKVEGSFLQSPLEGQSKGRGSYSV